MIISSLFLTSDTLMAAHHLLTRVQSSTTKVNIAKNRARYKYDLGAQELTPNTYIYKYSSINTTTVS